MSSLLETPVPDQQKRIVLGLQDTTNACYSPFLAYLHPQFWGAVC